MAGEQNLPFGARFGNVAQNNDATKIAVFGDPDGSGLQLIGYIEKASIDSSDKLPLAGGIMTGDIEISTPNLYNGLISPNFTEGFNRIGFSDEKIPFIKLDVEDDEYDILYLFQNFGLYLNTPIENAEFKGIVGSRFFNKQNDPNAFPQLGDFAVQKMYFDFSTFSGNVNAFYAIYRNASTKYVETIVNLSVTPTDINSVIVDDYSYFDRVTQNSILKKINFSSEFAFLSSFSFELGIYKSDDVAGTNSELIYTNTFSTTVNILKVNQDVNISVESGKIIHLFFRIIGGTSVGHSIRNFSLEFFNV